MSNKNLTFKKDGITFDVTTKAENVRFNESNLKEEINKINERIETISTEGGGVIVDNSEHNNSKINSEEGIHGLRYFDEKFSIKEDNEWVDVINKSDGNNGSGIKLPSTKFIEIRANNTSVTIKWEDADNQILNGVIISTWKGTKLIKKEDSPPTNEFDGEILIDNVERNKYKINGYVDENIQLGKVYYYALFPYSTDDTYNYDILNIRKFYKLDVDVPENTTNIRVIPDRKFIKLLWSDGASTSQSLWAGTKIIRKIGSPPVSETDGTLIIDNTSRDKYKTTHFTDDTATQNLEYFYGFFPYSRDGYYNTNIENVASGTPSTGKIYTLSINMNNISPDGACSYEDDASGRGVGDAWDETDIFQIKPCLLKNGKVNYYLNKDDYTKKEDGTPSNLSGVDGDVMVEIPFICFGIFKNGNNITCSLSTDKQLIKSILGYNCYPFIDRNGNIADKIYVGAYQGIIEDNNLYSNSGKVINTKYSTKEIFDACRNRGEHYLPYSYSIHQLLVFLYMMRFKTRSYIDYLSNGSSTWINETGTLNKNGMWYKEM